MFVFALGPLNDTFISVTLVHGRFIGLSRLHLLLFHVCLSSIAWPWYRAVMDFRPGKTNPISSSWPCPVSAALEQLRSWLLLYAYPTHPCSRRKWKKHHGSLSVFIRCQYVRSVVAISPCVIDTFPIPSHQSAHHCGHEIEGETSHVQ